MNLAQKTSQARLTADTVAVSEKAGLKVLCAAAGLPQTDKSTLIPRHLILLGSIHCRRHRPLLVMSGTRIQC